MEYKISQEPPEPIYSKAKERWGVDFNRTVFTYGDTIHSKRGLSPDLLAHELVHVGQQTKMGKDAWWDQYFDSDIFRLSQEVEAYREQYRWVSKNIADRNVRASLLVFYAKALSGDMYGNLISMTDAIKLINQWT